MRAVCLLAVLAIAATASAQGRFTNARTETHAASQGADSLAFTQAYWSGGQIGSEGLWNPNLTTTWGKPKPGRF